jgi:hypothetical protein
MVSFIIPTIYKSKRLISLLRSLDVHSLVSEILLIEDCPYTGMLDGYNFNKLNIVPFQERKFCNGGWNLGVLLSKNYYHALCSDDILFPTSIIDDVIHFYKLRPKSGVIGMDSSQYEIEYKPLVYGFDQKQTWETNQGWGALQFNHKNNPLIIPEDLKTLKMNFAGCKFNEKIFAGMKNADGLKTKLGITKDAKVENLDEKHEKNKSKGFEFDETIYEDGSSSDFLSFI